MSGSFQAFDQGYLIDALAALGPTFARVTQIPSDTTDDDIRALHDARVRAVRFNIAHGGSADLDGLETLARRVHDLERIAQSLSPEQVSAVFWDNAADLYLGSAH
ncbi:UNVERIFIED_CONTAM: hypothetical protein RF649_01920 [Kocuria sp. CPCC 205295]